jgi:hypothetical protein
MLRRGRNPARSETASACEQRADDFTISEGTSEIQRMIIDRAVTGLDVRWS